jgi:hypothetical protein
MQAEATSPLADLEEAEREAADRATGQMWKLWFRAGHGGCDGWGWDAPDDFLTCSCGARVPLAEAAAG